jgi:hypothetical protein
MMARACRCLPPLAVLALLALPLAASAHRLDEYLQATLVSIEPDAVRLSIQLTPGVDVADVVVALVDQDHDGSISADEAAAYVGLLERDLIAGLNGVQVRLKVESSDFPAPAELRTGSGTIRVEFMAPISVPAGIHGVTLENHHLPGNSVYLLNAGRPNSRSVRITRQRRNDNQSAGTIEFSFRPESSSSGAVWIAVALAALIAAATGRWAWPRRS